VHCVCYTVFCALLLLMDDRTVGTPSWALILSNETATVAAAATSTGGQRLSVGFSALRLILLSSRIFFRTTHDAACIHFFTNFFLLQFFWPSLQKCKNATITFIINFLSPNVNCLITFSTIFIDYIIYYSV